MQTKTYQKLVAFGLDTILIDKIANAGLTISGLRGLSHVALLNLGFHSSESEIISAKLNRQPISKGVLTHIFELTGGICCYCSDGNPAQPYQIHHIAEYHLTQDNSADNLLLVCPTHHVMIHTNGIPEDDQKLKRKEWQAIWRIAQDYQVKGIPFPFGSFEHVSYEQIPAITELFDFSKLSPATCLSVLDDGNRASAGRTLSEEHYLIVTGASGSGKTTLAKGLAGTLNGYQVFSHLSRRNDRDAVQDILTFCSLANVPIVLIIDNANIYLSESEIEVVLKAAGPTKKIIIIQTRASHGAENHIEEHFVNGTFPMNWDRLRYGIKEKLLAHEHEVITYLRSQKFNYGRHFDIGEGKMSQPLAQVIDNYSRSVKTAYEFFYLFSSGTDRINKLQLELAAYDHLDLVLAFISMNQISRVEAGTSLGEIRALYQQHTLFKDQPLPEDEWLSMQLAILQKKRLIRNERGRFNTVHREFGRRFIEHSYFMRREVTHELLIRVFSAPERCNEITALWSWLKDTSARSFIGTWARQLSKEELVALISAAIKKGLPVISLLADQMFLLTFSVPINSTGIFDGNASELASLLHKDQPEHIFYLRKLVGALHQLQPEMIGELIERLDQETVVTLIKNAPPHYFQDIGRLFNQLREYSPDWVASIAIMLTNTDFEAIIEKIEPGGIDELQEVVEFQREYLHDIRKSQYLKYTAKFAVLLKNCPLKDIRYSAGMSSAFWEIRLYPEELSNIVNGLNITQLASELSDCLPRDWDNLGMLALLTYDLPTNVFEQIIEGIDIGQLVESIAKYYKNYHYELRVFLYLLAYGRRKKRRAIALALRSFVHEILVKNDLKDSNDVFAAYYSLNERSGVELATELGIGLPLKFKRPVLSNWSVYIKQAAAIGRSEPDHLMSRVRAF